MKKAIGFFLCIACVFTFSAYDWGRKSKPKTEPKETQTTYAATQPVSVPATPVASTKKAVGTYHYGEQQAVSSTASSNVSGKTRNTYEKAKETVPAMTQTAVQAKAVQTQVAPPQVKAATPPANVTADTTAAANDKAVAIVTLAKIVGSGTPEERKARIESLKRLSQALAKSQGQQT